MPDLVTAIPGLLQQYDIRVRQEAERLVEDGAVVNLEAAEGQFAADVMLDEDCAHVEWRLENHEWTPFTDAEPRVQPLAACAALLAAQKQPKDFQGTATELPFQMRIEQRLGRQLTPDEELYLGKLEKRYERVRQTGQIFDQDMVRLHPKWSIESVEPLALWPARPRTAEEFCNYVALALSERNLQVPAFLRAITDPNALRERLRDWRLSRTVPLWRERVKRFNAMRSQTARSRRSIDLRLMVTVADARLQFRAPQDDAFRPVDPGMLLTLKREQAAGGLILDSAAELLLLACLCQAENSPIDVFRLDIDRHARWLGSLFHQPALRERLVTLDGLAFQYDEEILRWTSNTTGDQSTLEFGLAHPSGRAVPTPLRMLQGVQTLYLSGDTIFKGPPWLGDETRIEGRIAMPVAALSSSEGIEFLAETGVQLPEVLASRVRHETLRPQIDAKCLARPQGSGPEYAVFQVQAVDTNGRVVEHLTDSGWAESHDAPPSDPELIMCRDRSELDQAAKSLEDLRPVFDPEHRGFRVRLTRNFPEQFHSWASGLPEGLTLHADERLHSILADPLIARVRLEASQSQSIDWFDLRLVFEIDGADLKPADIRRLVAAKGGFVLLADGTWRRVQLQLSEEQMQMIDQLGIDLDELNEDAHRVHWKHLAAQRAAEVLNPRAMHQIQERLATAELEMRPPVPEALQLTLRPYQIEGFHFLSYLTANRLGGILADDMGLGKTVQSITWILWLQSRAAARSGGPVSPTLVVCPKSVLDVWAAEFAKAAPQLRVQVLRDREEMPARAGLGIGIDVLVLNYAQLRGCIDTLATVNWLAVILDEGQQIKNPDSKAARSARQLRSENRVVLTGTPMENRLLDLWSLMTFATPGALGDRAYFQRHFDRRKDGKAAERLSARLRPFILRRTKGQVAKELPPRMEENMLCEMTEEQERLYREELSRAQQMVLTASGFEVLQKRRFAILQALTRLRQICCHPSLVDKSNARHESAKLTATLELIEELHAEGHKVLLFSQFVTMLTIIRGRLEEMGLPYHWLTGASSNRADIVRAFQEDDRASVFLLSLKAGGSGLNLTAASYVILYDPWWNPAVENQAIDRAHRIGQTQPVMAYRMLTKNTIEEKILTLQQKKLMLSNNILGEESFGRALDKTDLEFLFEIEAEEDARLEALKEDRRRPGFSV